MPHTGHCLSLGACGVFVPRLSRCLQVATFLHHNNNQYPRPALCVKPMVTWQDTLRFEKSCIYALSTILFALGPNLCDKHSALRKSAAPIRMPLHQSLVAALQSECRCTRISWQSPIRVTAPLKRVASFPHPSPVECECVFSISPASCIKSVCACV